MKLKYYLVKLFLSGILNKFRAQVDEQNVVRIEDFARRMANKGTAASEAEILGNFQLQRETMLDIIKDGQPVETPLGILHFSIQGSFEHEDESFNRSKHTIKGNLKLHREFQTAIQQIQTEKIKPKSNLPTITRLVDTINEQNPDDTLTAGTVAYISGSDIKIASNEDGDATDSGIYFIDDQKVETKVVSLVSNEPSKVIFLVPATLSAGDYTIDVRTYYTRGRESKKLRVGTYQNEVQIVS